MIEIKPLEKEKVDEFVTTHLTCWEETYTGIFPKNVMESRWKKKEDRMIHIKKNLDDKAYFYYALMNDFSIIGILIFSTLDQIAVLDAIYIKKKYQHQKNGTKLIQWMEKILQEKKLNEYYIYVFKPLSSNAFFTKMNAQKVGEEPISIHGTDYTEIEYKKKIGDL